ncbi:MAG: hypothetical protein EHM58_10030 [Ignavibacteriae bacterium]|nr:MAG: hypothetical protein EHM58_10030 [Ignavibacteriota bacterium]
MNTDSLRAVILNEIYSDTINLLILGSIIILSALIGGTVSWIFRNDPLPANVSSKDSEGQNSAEVKRYSILNSIFVSLAGAVIVPLFLNLGGNGILKESRLNPINYFAFAGFCVLGAVFARDFLNSMSKTLLKKVDDLDKKIDEKVKDALKQKDEALKDSSKKIIDSTQVLRKEINKVKEAAGLWDSRLRPEGDDLKRSNMINGSEERCTMEMIDKRIEECINIRRKKRAPSNDPQKYQWGGNPESKDRVLTAKVIKLQKYWYQIDIEIQSKSKNNPLYGPILLYVHDSFQFANNRIILDVDKDGVAREEIRAYGAFTIGAVCDCGETFLELDLAELENVDREFREN